MLVAPDSFKGTFSAADVAAALAAGIRDTGREAVELPLADGGEGTIEVLAAALGAEIRAERVHDPLGRPITASFALLGSGEAAIVEMAQASGLARVAPDERDAWAASTYGTGELIAAAARAGARKVIVSVGGSATTDGGAGALAALDEAGIDVELELLCDVRTSWELAPSTYGPQKGADPETVRRLERRLDELAARAPRDPRGVPMTGAAGGLSGGLWAFRGARLVAGAASVLDLLDFDERASGAAVVVTGEGRLDDQTLEGKVVAEVAARCRSLGRPCYAVVGESALRREGVDRLGLSGVREATTLPELREAGARLARAAVSPR
ncbi:MAG TPA: glycerate kinase [Gaiellaceae bacterium]|nr:glycerate kinase [Gaiellaceae bacterium]